MAASEQTPLLQNCEANCLTYLGCCPGGEQRVDGVDGDAKGESKTHLANERTFLHWISVSILLGMLSLTILKFYTVGPVVEILGHVYFTAAIGFLIYSLAIFNLRQTQIQQGKQLQSGDIYAPTVLTTTLVAAFITTGCIQMGILY
eukprot:GGOE01013634.1.p1 GENE.GGOE01013634.1~~GGOE01013634.1.p1  ORF type:complete len:158 (-),score=37.85 GGOE01013634.1:104-541(-)